MVNTMVLVSCRYQTHLWCMPIFSLNVHHLTVYNTHHQTTLGLCRMSSGFSARSSSDICIRIFVKTFVENPLSWNWMQCNISGIAQAVLSCQHPLAKIFKDWVPRNHNHFLMKQNGVNCHNCGQLGLQSFSTIEQWSSSCHATSEMHDGMRSFCSHRETR